MGERGSKGKDKQKARALTHFIRRCVLRVTEQSTASRRATQIASEKQIASSKHSTKYVDERSKARRHRSTARRRSKARSPKQSTTSEAKHDVSHAYCELLVAKSFFPTLCPPLGGPVGGGGRRRRAYNACASPETAAGSGRGCSF